MDLRDLLEYEGRSVPVVLAVAGRQVLAVERLRRYECDRDPDTIMLEPIDDALPGVINGPGVLAAHEVQSIRALTPKGRRAARRS